MGGTSPQWLLDIIAAVRAVQDLRARSAKTAGSGGQDRRLGRVRRDVDEGEGWYWLRLGQRGELDLDEAYLAPSGGGAHRKYGLVEAVQDGETVRVRVANPNAPDDGLVLWAPAFDARVLEESLLDRLGALQPNDLLARFGTRVLSTEPTVADAPPGLNAGQQRAWAAARGSGVHLVWGPPGTGKTMVITRAIEDLLRRGKSVLLVSGTNVAVDNAIAGVATELDLESGAVVRVGTPHVQKVADDPRVCLTALIRERERDLVEQQADIADRINIVSADPVLSTAAEARERLTDFDARRYAESRKRIAACPDLGRARQRLEEATSRSRAAHEQRSVAKVALAEAHMAVDAAAGAAGLLDRAAVLEQEIDARQSDRDRAATDVIRLDAEIEAALSRLESAGGGWLGRRKAQRNAESELENLRDRHHAARQRLAEVDTILARTRQMNGAEASRLRDRAHPITADEIARRRDELNAREDAAKQADNECLQAEAHLAQVTFEHADTVERQPSPDDLQYVRSADERGLPSLHAELPELERRATSARKELDALEARLQEVVELIDKHRRESEQTIIAEARVVATTLARLRLKRAVHQRRYDYVIVDEAAASPLPEVLCAVGLADSGATLLGDFLQNAPIVADEVRRADENVRRHVASTSFDHFGVTSPDTAARTPGCIALDIQYRFGSAVTELANRVAYAGMLDTGNVRTETEIVLVDVDGLGSELADPRRASTSGRWWPIGALLARMLVESHTNRHNESVGVLTPYKAQCDLIKDMLADSPALRYADVGTAHAFQGREFDVAVFDMVEDGRSWVARGDLKGNVWAQSALRLFNVAVTRARRRLYIVGSMPAIRRAKTGPLAALAAMIEADMITVTRAADLLHLEHHPDDGSAAYDLWDAFRTYAEVVDIYDEETLPAALTGRITGAQREITMWSPWVGRRSRDFIDALRAAAERGVDVRIVVLPDNRVNTSLGAYSKQLRDELTPFGGKIVFLDKEHQKIIVLDDDLAFIGSMNVLSHTEGGRHETMVLLRSHHLVRELLAHERAGQLFSTPPCGQCQRPMNYIAQRTISGDRALHWVCRACKQSGAEYTRPLPEAGGQRNPGRRTHGGGARRSRPPG